jgi:hypothetical protein
MAMETTTSGLLARLGEKARKAHEAHKNDPLDNGNAGLPAGIEGGVAQLHKMQFAVYKDGKNKGQLYFIASGVAKQPYHLDGIPIRGGHTQIGPEPLCDTPTATGKRKTFEAHYAWVLNQVRLFGVNPDSSSELEATMKALVMAKPHFKFRTWKGPKATSGPYANREPRIVHEWNGRCDYSEEIDPGAGEEDSTEVLEPSENGEVVGGQEEFNEFENQNGQSEEDSTSTEMVSKEEDYNSLTLEQLLEKANQDDETAARILGEKAMEAGNSEEDVTDANDWQDIVDMIKNPRNKKEEVEEEVNTGPKVGQTYLYRPMDKTTKKPSTKTVEVKVLEVDEDEKTVLVKGPKVTYQGVPWTRLETK